MPPCPHCESNNLRERFGPADPGQWCEYDCLECGHEFSAVAPEPEDDSVWRDAATPFAENH